ncbi:MAG: SurA N-terminal domain-containing protein [Thermoplasmata archaeon]|nr:SurA N-terminal domain-containing protein [Thermoplasmata archaeon]
MKLNRKTLRSWAIKIIAILIVLAMIFTGFVVILWN